MPHGGNEPPVWLSRREDGVRLIIRVQPRSSRDGHEYREGEDWLRIRVKAPPVDGEANAAVGRYIAKLLGVSRSQVTFEAGETSKNKRLHIADVSVDGVLERLGISTPH